MTCTFLFLNYFLLKFRKLNFMGLEVRRLDGLKTIENYSLKLIKLKQVRIEI